MTIDFSNEEELSRAEALAQNPATPEDTLDDLLVASSKFHESYLGSVHLHEEVRKRVLEPLLRNPNLDVGMLKIFVRKHPIPVSQNPSIALVDLEWPGFAFTLCQEAAMGQSTWQLQEFFRGDGILAAIGDVVVRWEFQKEFFKGKFYDDRHIPEKGYAILLPLTIEIHRSGIVVWREKERYRVFRSVEEIDVSSERLLPLDEIRYCYKVIDLAQKEP